ncbi:hypothetical protein Misp01_49130 [Microtetraspora sp. NBRC 13810]|uniref:hypothetical protein n=1 Tax=Microtetraspora sp. NBRC 13810 TaxID=3030990 RepID=UPI0024A0E72C|nr:hypothetical protein [Microtetraspora sp. NBRC 13810]GLW09784.1 hypothetical protein Misp01_49130 [Microtetraspora sp. NBRC 13810]
MIPGRVLDVSALVDIAVGKTSYSRSVTTLCLLRGGGIVIPSTALAEVFSIAPLDTQVELDQLATTEGVRVDDFTAGKVSVIGEILDGSRDVTAAHVIWCARSTGWPILTDRGDEIARYDPHVEIDPVP